MEPTRVYDSYEIVPIRSFTDLNQKLGVSPAESKYLNGFDAKRKVRSAGKVFTAWRIYYEKTFGRCRFND
jgi:hypothetical protein